MDAQLIRLIRINAGMNQLEFSQLIEESRSQVALVEAGYREASDKMIEAIRNKFDAKYIGLIEKVMAHENKTA